MLTGIVVLSHCPSWIGMLPHDVHDPVKGCVPDKAWISQGRDSPLAPSAPPKPGKQTCPASPTCVDYPDQGWRKLNVPHDFVVTDSERESLKTRS